MIFTIIKIGLKGKSFYNDPKNFTEGAVKEIGMSALILPVISAVILLGLLFIFGFTGLIGGPFIFAKILFWIAFIIYGFLSVPLYIFWKIVRNISKHAGKQTGRIFVDSQVKE